MLFTKSLIVQKGKSFETIVIKDNTIIGLCLNYREVLCSGVFHVCMFLQKSKYCRVCCLKWLRIDDYTVSVQSFPCNLKSHA